MSMEDGTVFIKRSMDFKFGEDDRGVFLEYRNMIDDVVRQYYEKVDEALLKNMPDKMFYDLADKINEEIARRHK